MTTTNDSRSATTPSPHNPRTTGLTLPIASAFLLVDAALTGANGLAYVVAGGWLADWFGAPTDLVRTLGLFLLVVAAGVVGLARRNPVPRRGVAMLAALNVVWVLASVYYAVTGGLTALGVAWTLLQALVVGAFAAAQVWLARRG